MKLVKMRGVVLQTCAGRGGAADLRADKPSNLGAVSFERRCSPGVGAYEETERKSVTRNRNQVCMLSEIWKVSSRQAGCGGQLRQDADGIYGLVRSDSPIRPEFAGRSGEGGQFGARKTTVAVIKKDRYGLSEPRGGDDQVGGVATADIARLNDQAASRGEKTNRLPAGRKMKLKPVISATGIIRAGLNAGEIGTKIPV